MIIDDLLPNWDVAAKHSVGIDATADVVYGNVRTLDMGGSWSIRQLFRLRGLPRHALTIGGLESIGFALLADAPPREMVLGIIGRFWTPSGKLRRTSAAHFRTFADVRAGHYC